MTTVADELHIIEITSQQTLQVPAPQECLDLLGQAQRAGIVVVQLYALRAPLSPRKLGGFVRDGADIWILYDESREGALPQALRCELYTLAQAEARTWQFATIDEDWDEVRRLWERAAELANLWGLEYLFPADFLRVRLEEAEVLREQHWYAGYLAGSLTPHVARAAYDALCEIREREGWTPAFFGEALAGLSGDERANRSVLGFNRCLLGRSWRLPYQPGKAFGEIALPPTPRSDRLLRSALTSCAEHPAVLEQLNWQRHRSGETVLEFLQVEDDQDLYAVIGVLNTLLLEEVPDSKLAQWYCYGGSERRTMPPLYRLTVNYGESRESGASAAMLSREVWILFPSRHARHLDFEAALQCYIASWLAWQGVEVEGSRDGLATLWGWLK
jgi:hypothetical protein